MKKTYFLFLIALAAVTGLYAQAPILSPTVIASTGGFSTNGGNSLSYTVGEMTMVQTFTGGGNILTQGFQQPNDTGTINGLLSVTQDEFGSFVVYPNPAVDNFYYGFQLPEAGKVNIVLYNELGQKTADILTTNYESGKQVNQTNVSGVAAGIYFVSMIFTSNTDGKTHVTTKKLQILN
jgi:hypothetical protein